MLVNIPSGLNISVAILCCPLHCFFPTGKMAIPVLAVISKLSQMCWGEGDLCLLREASCAAAGSPRDEVGSAVELWQQGGVTKLPLSPTSSALSFDRVKGSNIIFLSLSIVEENQMICQKCLVTSNGFFTWLTVGPGSIKLGIKRSPCLENVTI